MPKSDRKEQLSNFREYLKTKETCHLRAIVCNFRIFLKKSRPPNFTDMAEIWHEGWFQGPNHEMGIKKLKLFLLGKKNR